MNYDKYTLRTVESYLKTFFEARIATGCVLVMSEIVSTCKFVFQPKT